MQDIDNPYAAPASNRSDVHVVIEGEKRKLFSPTQGAVGAFFFGPLAGLYMVQANFAELGQSAKRSTVITYGLILSFAIIFIFPFLPEKTPSIIFSLLYMIPTRIMIEQYQLKKEQIVRSDQYIFHSNWFVFGLSVLAAIVYFLMLVSMLFALGALGWIEPLW